MVHEVMESSNKKLTPFRSCPFGDMLDGWNRLRHDRKWGGKRVGEGIRKRNGNGGWKDSRRQSQIGFNHSRLRNCYI